MTRDQARRELEVCVLRLNAEAFDVLMLAAGGITDLLPDREMGGLSDVSLKIEMDDLNGADPNFKTLSGLDLDGKLRGQLALGARHGAEWRAANYPIEEGVAAER